MVERTISPWLHQLRRTRPVATLPENHPGADIAIIGAGIAGVSTAFWTLKNTDHSVLLIDAGRVAHGATGHNAGQLVTYFERPFYDIVAEYGLEAAITAQAAVDNAWELLDEIVATMKATTPIIRFTGYAGCRSLKEVTIHLENNVLWKQAGYRLEQVLIASDHPIASEISKRYDGLFERIPQAEILARLETDDTSFCATLATQKGCANSALLTEEIVTYLQKTFPKRFTLAEETPIKTVKLATSNAQLEAEKITIQAKRVVLCTNGFERITLINEAGPDIDMKFHHTVRGAVGYMAGFLEPVDRPATAISYLTKDRDAAMAYETDPYFYLTRRPFEFEEGAHHSLVCIGGPEALMDDTTGYHQAHPYPDEANALIDRFLTSTYRGTKNQSVHYRFRWHGLMGYTPNGLRVVGPEPCNTNLLYNLGCNGVGLLPSIFGGKRIADFLSGNPVEPMIFDPKDQRCDLPSDYFSKRT